MSSNFGYFDTQDIPVTALQYPDMADMPQNPVSHREHGASHPPEPNASQTEERLAEIDLNARIAQERADAAREMEERLSQLHEQRMLAAKAPIAAAIAGFAERRNEYFARVEAEVVQLALSIARKVLHREAQVDPMLVAALVRIAIEKLRDGSTVTVRVSPARVASWKAYFAGQSVAARAQVIADAALTDLDCLLETELGTANFGLDTQLKEVEQGFFDLLALRPVNR
ncbi:MAG: FliH/SctL family protein [Terracidiphilus sp.]|jgi:flagellar assembly protein FliH